MPCFRPLKGYRSKYVNESGKRSIVFNTTDGFKDLPVTVPCGQCRYCRLDYSRQWAIRCVHESQLHNENSFITLTYNDEHLPKDRSIHKEELVLFFKRFRKKLWKMHGSEQYYNEKGELKNRPKVPIRYFACGEYGTQKNRPHYHAIIFGYDFPDKELYSKRHGNLYFKSKMLQELWSDKDKNPIGFCTIGNVTFESAAYVARYVTKKFNNQDKEKEFIKYSIVDPETGELFKLEKEFALMSRNPGIGAKWLQKFKTDTDKDFIVVNGKKMPLPKYYDNLLEKYFDIDMEERKSDRKKKMNRKDNTPERLKVKEKIKEVQYKLLKRTLEDYNNDT